MDTDDREPKPAPHDLEHGLPMVGRDSIEQLMRDREPAPVSEADLDASMRSFMARLTSGRIPQADLPRGVR